MSQTERLGLVNGRHVSPSRDGENLRQSFGFSPLGQECFKLRARRKMGACYRIAGAGDEHDLGDASRNRLLNAVLNNGPVEERQQFLWERFCRREDSGPETGGGKDDGGHGRRHIGLIVSARVAWLVE